MVARDPVEGDGAAIFDSEALPAQSDLGNGAKEGGEDGLDVAVPGEERGRIVGEAEGGVESLEEAITRAAYDLEGWVVSRHCYFGGDVADGEWRKGVARKGGREFGHWL